VHPATTADVPTTRPARTGRTAVWSRPQLWWRTGIVLAGLVGILMGSPRLAFYTSQSNVIVLGYFAGCVYWMLRRDTVAPAAPRLRGAVTLWILVTALVSHVLLEDGANPLPGLVDDDPAEAVRNWSRFLLHYVVPVMVLVDWVAFGPRGSARWRDLPLWLVFPTFYGLSSMLRALAFPTVDNRYPYFFLDPREHGYDCVLAHLAVLIGFFAVLGALLIALDRALLRREERRIPGWLERRAGEPGVAQLLLGVPVPLGVDAE
jgi:hypothetical protein